MDTIDVLQHTTIKQEIEDTFPIENDQVFGINLINQFEPNFNCPVLPATGVKNEEVEHVFQKENETSFPVLSQREEDPLAVSPYVAVKIDPSSDLTASNIEGCQALPTLFIDCSTEVLSSSLNLNLYGPKLESTREDVNLKNNNSDKSENGNTCRKSFSKKISLTKYARDISNANGKHQCQICRKNYPWASDLDRHQRRHTGEKPYKCETCNKNFSQASSLKCHQRVHTGDKPYKCDICHRSFAFDSNLKHHQRIHTGDKPYQCEMCNKKFSRADSLRYHKRIHTGEKPYKCETCNKNYSQASSLKYHQKVHTGDKPYKCDICHRSFEFDTKLKHHQRIQTGDKPYKCEVCNRNFCHSSTFNYHQKNHSKDGSYEYEISNAKLANA